jgi:hypothetical protein
MPRFGALAPAIISHQSPRSREAAVARLVWPGSHPPLCCAEAVRTPPHRAERYRTAIR